MPNGNVLPRWNDPGLKAGTKVRTALWLLSEVGLGNVFTKEQHRQAFPGVSQADRRLRDLRALGWVIHTNLEDVILNSNEQRFVAAGLAIWDPAIKKGSGATRVTPKQRRALFARAGYQCESCGIAGGEKYPDSPRTSAILSITNRMSINADGESLLRHFVECKRCQDGGDNQYDDIADLMLEVGNLSEPDRNVLTNLMNQTAGSALLRTWAKYRNLSPACLKEARALISKMSEDHQI